MDRTRISEVKKDAPETAPHKERHFAFRNKANIDMLIEEPGSNPDEEEEDEEQPEWASEEILPQKGTEKQNTLQPKEVSFRTVNSTTKKMPFKDPAILEAQLNDGGPSPHVLQIIKSAQSCNDWYYKDPNGTIQGPFRSEEMFAWFRDGYFPESLEIRCGMHSSFFPLREFKNTIPRSNFFDFLDQTPTHDGPNVIAGIEFAASPQRMTPTQGVATGGAQQSPTVSQFMTHPGEAPQMQKRTSAEIERNDSPILGEKPKTITLSSQIQVNPEVHYAADMYGGYHHHQ